MVNPVKKLNRKILRQLTSKQKTMVKNIKQIKKLSLNQLGVYKRAGASSGYSIKIKKKSRKNYWGKK